MFKNLRGNLAGGPVDSSVKGASGTKLLLTLEAACDCGRFPPEVDIQPSVECSLVKASKVHEWYSMSFV